jgi:hypothetical protein
MAEMPSNVVAKEDMVSEEINIIMGQEERECKKVTIIELVGSGSLGGVGATACARILPHCLLLVGHEDKKLLVAHAPSS